MTSAAFERFRFSFFEDPNSARDALDSASLCQLVGEERSRAEDMLIAFLPDTRAVIGLGVLRSHRAEPRLVELFEAERQARGDAKQNGNWYAHALVALARALWLIDPDPRWPAAAIDTLAHGRDWTERTEAAIALQDVRDPAAVAALIGALDDADALVRHHAARGLLTIHGLPIDSKDPEHMVYRVMSEAAPRRAGGKQDILAAIAGQPILAK